MKGLIKQEGKFNKEKAPLKFNIREKLNDLPYKLRPQAVPTIARLCNVNESTIQVFLDELRHSNQHLLYQFHY
jgi:hypothetical protein